MPDAPRAIIGHASGCVIPDDSEDRAREPSIRSGRGALTHRMTADMRSRMGGPKMWRLAYATDALTARLHDSTLFGSERYAVFPCGISSRGGNKEESNGSR